MGTVHDHVPAPFQPSRPESVSETADHSLFRHTDSLLLQFLQDAEHHQCIHRLVLTRQGDSQVCPHAVSCLIIRNGIPCIGFPDPDLLLFRNNQRRFFFFRPGVQHILNFFFLRRITDYRYPVFDDACLFTRDLCQGIAEILHMIHTDCRNGTDSRIRYSIGRIKPSAHSRLRYDQLRFFSLERMKRQGSTQFKWRAVIIQLPFKLLRRVQCFVTILCKLFRCNRFSVQPDPLIVRLQEGRGIHACPVSCRCQHAVQHGADASLSVCTGHMDHRTSRPCL